MKRAIQFLVVICFCASVSYGAFDHVISDTYEHGTIHLNDQSLLVAGAGVAEIIAKGSSYVEITGTTAPLQLDTGGIYSLLLDGNSSMYYSGGETGGITFYSNAAAVLVGGRIDFMSSFQYILQPNQEVLRHIEIVCDVESVVHDIGTNILTGNWKDGTGFEIQLVDQDGYDPVIDNMFFTPEPLSIALFGVGVFFVRRRRRA